MSASDDGSAPTASTPAVGSMATTNLEVDAVDSKKRHQSSSPVVDDDDRTRCGQRKFAKEYTISAEKDETDQNREGSTNLAYSDKAPNYGSPVRQLSNDFSEKKTPGLNDSLYEKLLNLKEKVRDSKPVSLANRPSLYISPLIRTAFNSELGNMAASADHNTPTLNLSQGKDEDHNYSFENNLFLRAMSLSIDSMQGSLNRNTGSIDRNSASINTVLERVTHVEVTLEERAGESERANSELSKLIKETKSYVDVRVDQLKTAIPSTLADIENDFDDKLKTQSESLNSLVKNEIKNTCSLDYVSKMEKRFNEHLIRVEQETKNQFANFSTKIDKLISDVERGVNERKENREELNRLKENMKSLTSDQENRTQIPEINSLKSELEGCRQRIAKLETNHNREIRELTQRYDEKYGRTNAGRGRVCYFPR